MEVPSVSTDELTGIQALERKAPPKPMLPGHVERRACEYERHDTRSAIVNVDGATGGGDRSLAGTNVHRTRLYRPHGVHPGARSGGGVGLGGGLAEHPSIRASGRSGRGALRAEGGGYPAACLRWAEGDGQPRVLAERSDASDPVCVYTQAYLVAQSDRAVVQHPGAARPQTGNVPSVEALRRTSVTAVTEVRSLKGVHA